MGNSTTTGLWDHLSALNPNSIKKALSTLRRFVHYVCHKLTFDFTLVVLLGLIARGLNLAALAGTIKIAAVVFFQWEQAKGIANALGFDGSSLTKPDVAWIGGGLIVLLYVSAGLAGYFQKLLKYKMRINGEHALLSSFFEQPRVTEFIAERDTRASAMRSIGAYARASVNLAEAISYTAMCGLILALLSLVLPMLIIFALAALLPLQAVYLVAGRRAHVASKTISNLEKERSEVFKQMLPKRAKRKQPATPITKEQLTALTQDYLRLTGKVSDKRQTMLKGQSSPDLVFAVVSGAVLATAIVVLSSMETTTERLIYLLIGFLLIRFLFIFIRSVLSNSQSIIQDLDQIRFVHDTVLDGRDPVPSATATSSEPLDDLENDE
ncbi:MAG: hypothetical protein RIC14_09700 [Filomicrobium sp.]